MLYTDKLREQLEKNLQNIELKERKTKYSMIISKEVEDRDWETVILSWMDMKNYKKNPVVLIDHSYKVESIVGKTTKLKMNWNQLEADFVFVDTENGKLAEKLYEAGLLKASSIGFLAKERDPQDYRKITKSELLEWSLVAVPANASALSLDEKTMTKAMELWLIKEVEEEVEEEIADDDNVEKANELDEIKAELAEIKSILKSLADDKAEQKTQDQEIAKQEADIKAKKELLQAINKGVSDTLAKMKLL